MKKVLFLMIAAALTMSGFAQRATVSKEMKNLSVTVEKPSALRISDGSQVQAMQFNKPQNMVSATRGEGYGPWDEAFLTMTTNYDLQSNSAIGNRVAAWPDGTASFTATWDASGDSNFPDRGTGYNYYDGEDIGDEPEARQEPMKSGWPSIAACGDGEYLASHATGVNLYYRPTKGEGDWTLIQNWGAAYGSPTWPRVVVSGPNNEYVHVVMAKQISMGDYYDNHVYYTRGTRNGNDWTFTELVDMPGLDNATDGEYRNQLSADDYVMAANGNNVAVMFSSYTTDVFYLISHDNGETWERQVIAPYPILDAEGNAVHAIDFDDYPDPGMTDTITTSDGSHSIAIDDRGVVHATFGLFHWRVTDDSHYTYYPLWGYGLVYWNSEYVNEQGGHEIPLFGNFSGDVNHPDWAANGVGYTLEDERIIELSEADNYEHLFFFGVVDENGNGQLDFESEHITGETWHYRTYGWATLPGISVDGNGNVGIIFNAHSETRLKASTGFYLRSAYLTCKDSENNWFENVAYYGGEGSLFELTESEIYSTTASPRAYDGTFFFLLSGDSEQGLYLDISDTYPNSNGGAMSDNAIYAIKFVPAWDGWDGIEDHSDLNVVTSARVYPNPANGTLYVEVDAFNSSEANLSIYNIMGQKVAEKNVNFNGSNTVSINTNELSSGVYFVTVKANGFEKTMKFVVK